MNFPPTIKSSFLVLLILFAGCTGGDQPDSKKKKNDKPDPTSQADRALWEKTLKKYQAISSYSDSAEVTLQYQLGGKRTVEAQPSNVSFQRDGLRWKANSFRTTTWNSNGRFFQSILEPATLNLENQVLNGAGSDWEKIFSDPISLIYLSGQTDFPTKGNLKQGQWAPLFCPQLALLQNQNLKNKPFFLSQNAIVQKIGSGKIEQTFCQILEVRLEQQKASFWIDPENFWVRRIEFSHDLLLNQLTRTPEVDQLKLAISFNGIKEEPGEVLNQAPVFQRHHKSVTNFTKIPEKMASHWIGKPSPPIDGVSVSGQNWNLDQFHGRPVVAVFPAPFSSSTIEEWTTPLQSIAGDSDYSRGEFVLTLFGPPPVNLNPDSLAGISVLKNGVKLREKLQLPLSDTIVLWDGHGVIQYVGEVKKNTFQSTIKGLLKQLGQGESVALKMKSEYEKFYQGFLKELQAATGPDLPVQSQLASQNLAGSQTSQAAKSKEELALRTAIKSVWERKVANVNFIQSVQVNGQTQWWVLSGFRTIEVWDNQGTKIRSIDLKIPNNLAARQFFVTSKGNSQQIWTLDPGSNRIFQFNSDGAFGSQIQGNENGQIVSFQIQSDSKIYWHDTFGNQIYCYDIDKKQIIDSWKFSGNPGGLMKQFSLQPATSTVASGGNPGSSLSLMAVISGRQGEVYGLLSGGAVRTLSDKSSHLFARQSLSGSASKSGNNQFTPITPTSAGNPANQRTTFLFSKDSSKKDRLLVSVNPENLQLHSIATALPMNEEEKKGQEAEHLVDTCFRIEQTKENAPNLILSSSKNLFFGFEKLSGNQVSIRWFAYPLGDKKVQCVGINDSKDQVEIAIATEDHMLQKLILNKSALQ